MDLRLLDPRLFRTLASRPRAEILRALAERPHTPAELARRLGVADTTAQYHLDRLAAAGLARRRDDGRVWAYHELTSDGRALVPADARVPATLGALLAALAAFLAAAWWRAQPEPLPPGTIGFPVPAPSWAPWALAGAALCLGLAILTGMLAWSLRRGRGSQAHD